MAKGTATPLFNHDGTNTPLPLSMPRGTKFSTTIDGVTYPMFASDTTTINYNTTDGWLFSNIKIEQGTLASIIIHIKIIISNHILFLLQM